MFTQITEMATPQTMTALPNTARGGAHNLEDFEKRKKQTKGYELITCTKCGEEYYLTSLIDAIICPRCGADQR